MSKSSSKKTLVIGVGGPTSSGKTTLAKHLLSLIPSEKCSMLHQDDFALPEEQLPWNEVLQARDWDSPVGTVSDNRIMRKGGMSRISDNFSRMDFFHVQIDYRRMQTALEHFRKYGELPPHHSSHDHLNEQPNLPIKEESTAHWKRAFNSALNEAQIEKVLIADGFLLYYDEGVRRELDVRLFLRCDQATLIKRRESRGGYATAEGTVWQVSGQKDRVRLKCWCAAKVQNLGNQDPPGYFDHVIWPGYLKAHEKLFENGDVEKGKLLQPTEEIHGDGEQVKGMVMFEAQSLSLEDIINIAGKEIERGIRAQV